MMCINKINQFTLEKKMRNSSFEINTKNKQTKKQLIVINLIVLCFVMNCCLIKSPEYEAKLLKI